ncbi:MAG: hypothetical protein ACYTF0_00630 [Planctomycetota bacterium]
MRIVLMILLLAAGARGAAAESMLMTSTQANRVMATVLADPVASVSWPSLGGSLAGSAELSAGVIVLTPTNSFNRHRVDHVVLSLDILPGSDLYYVSSQLVTFAGSVMLSESYGPDGELLLGVAAGVDGQILERWQQVADGASLTLADLTGRVRDYDALALRRAGGGDQILALGATDPVANEVVGWVLTHAQASALMTGLDQAGSQVELFIDGAPLLCVVERMGDLVSLRPVDAVNPQRLDSIVIQLWPTMDGSGVDTILSTYAATVFIEERYDPSGTFIEGLAARVDGEVLREWRPQDQEQVSLDDLLFLARDAAVDLADLPLEAEDDLIRGGAFGSLSLSPLVVGVGGGILDPGAVVDQQPATVSPVGGI